MAWSTCIIGSSLAPDWVSAPRFSRSRISDETPAPNQHPTANADFLARIEISPHSKGFQRGFGVRLGFNFIGRTGPLTSPAGDHALCVFRAARCRF